MHLYYRAILISVIFLLAACGGGGGGSEGGSGAGNNLSPRSIWLRYFLAPVALKFLRHRSSA
jgi:hypothetical protein